MFQEFLIKKMLKSQGVPDNQIDMVMNIVKENPELFKKIAEETQQLVKSGKDQKVAAMEVMEKYKDELSKIKPSADETK